MKKVITSIAVLFFLIGFNQYASAKVLHLKADEEGQVIVEESKTALKKAVPEQEFSVEVQSATTFSTNTYKNGFFDNPSTTYTVSGGNIDAVIDNDLSSFKRGDSLGQIIKFDTTLEIKGYFVRCIDVNIQFYNKGNLIKNTRLSTVSSPNQYFDWEAEIDEIRFIKETGIFGYSNKLFEFEIFLQEPIEYITVSDLQTVVKRHDQALITFKNPESEDFRYNELLLDGKVIANLGKATSYTLNNLKELTEYEVTVRSYYRDGKFVEVTKKFKTPDIVDETPPGNVSNLNAMQLYNAVELTYELPGDSDFAFVQIYRNGVLIKNNYTKNTFIDESVQPDVEYIYKVISVDTSGNKSSGVSKSIKVIATEVKNLRAKADFDRVDLLWSVPDREDFEFARIYRKDENKSFSLFSLFSTNDDYTLIFETNGTFFNDLTVKPESKYIYKVTTIISGKESDGLQITVNTPKIKVGGIDVEKDENGDYIITWDKPTTGKIKVLVGGKQYKIVNASDKKIVIPAKDMKFTLLGDPDVTLIPLDENGNEIGVPTKPGTGNGGGIIGDIIGGGLERSDLTPGNLLLIGVSLLGLVGAFVLLGLAFKVVPKLIGSINDALRGKELKGGR